jgi:hypothetical protein
LGHYYTPTIHANACIEYRSIEHGTASSVGRAVLFVVEVMPTSARINSSVFPLNWLAGQELIDHGSLPSADEAVEKAATGVSLPPSYAFVLG